jgi:regulator of replication initiation timing
MFKRTKESNDQLLKLAKEWEARAAKAEKDLAEAKELQLEADELNHRIHLAGERVRKAESLIPSVGKGWD